MSSKFLLQSHTVWMSEFLLWSHKVWMSEFLLQNQKVWVWEFLLLSHKVWVSKFAVLWHTMSSVSDIVFYVLYSNTEIHILSSFSIYRNVHIQSHTPGRILNARSGVRGTRVSEHVYVWHTVLYSRAFCHPTRQVESRMHALACNKLGWQNMCMYDILY